MLAVIIILSFIGYAVFKWTIQNHAFFEKQNIAFSKPPFLLGHTGAMIMGLCHMDTYMRKLYGMFPLEKVVGVFDFRQPLLILRDPDVIKQLFVRDFQYFENHKTFIDPHVDEMFGNTLFILCGKKWRDMRTTLSPAFTGHKMRLMLGMVCECADNMVAALCERTAASGSTTMRADVKDLFQRFATDVIATTAFGIEVNSFANENNEFLVHAKRTITFPWFTSAMKMLGIRLVPRLMRWLNIQFIDSVATRYFRSMLLGTIQNRIENNILRPDMINLLMRVKTNSVNVQQHPNTGSTSESVGLATVGETSPNVDGQVNRNWTDTEVAAQCFGFFLAGFESSSTTMSLLCYELANNPEVQQQLFEECAEISRAQPVGQRLSYDTLRQMPFMDQVVSETLRLWPPALLADRVCQRNYEYDDGELRFSVKQGMSVWVPIFAMHRDERFYAEPNAFRPERFADEHKDALVPGTYLPFGAGPRSCIASRFALMEIKAIIYHILLEFSMQPSTETQIPLRLGKSLSSLKTDKSIILEFKRR